jgi:hypothetical protein
MTVTAYFQTRWRRELKYYRLRWWQCALLVCWSVLPWFYIWLLPHSELWLFIHAPFLPFGYIGGGLSMIFFPGQPWAYPLGYSFTVFLLTYLILVDWRQHCEGKHQSPPLQKNTSPQSGSRPCVDSSAHNPHHKNRA